VLVNLFIQTHDIDGRVKSLLYLAPAVTAGGTKNPAMRVYKMDRDTHEITDYDQYFLDMRTIPGRHSTQPMLLHWYLILSDRD